MKKRCSVCPARRPSRTAHGQLAAGFDPEAEKQAVKQEAKEETLIAKTETKTDAAQNVAQADTSTGFKLYESGQLHYEDDSMTVSD